MKKGKELIYEILISIPLSDFRQYVAYIEGSLEKEAEKYNEQTLLYAGEEVSGEFEQEYTYMIDSFIDDMTLFTHNFPRIMRNSLLISVYAFFEEKIISVCKGKEGELHFKDIRGNSNIERGRTYIEKVMHIDFPNNNAHWKFLNNVNEIRNCIVHNGSRVTGEKLRNITREMEKVHISNHGKIVIEKHFIEEMITHVDKLLTKLYLETSILKVDK